MAPALYACLAAAAGRVIFIVGIIVGILSVHASRRGRAVQYPSAAKREACALSTL